MGTKFEPLSKYGWKNKYQFVVQAPAEIWINLQSL